MPRALLLTDESLVRGDMYAASRFLAGDPFDYLELEDGRRVLAVAGYEAPRAARESGADEIWTFEDLGLRELLAQGLSRHELDVELTLRAVERAGADAVEIPAWYPVGTADRLRGAGIAVSIVPETERDRRRRKRPDQIEAI